MSVIQVAIANRLGIELVIFQGVVSLDYYIQALGLETHQLPPFQHLLSIGSGFSQEIFVNVSILQFTQVRGEAKT